MHTPILFFISSKKVIKFSIVIAIICLASGTVCIGSHIQKKQHLTINISPSKNYCTRATIIPHYSTFTSDHSPSDHLENLIEVEPRKAFCNTSAVISALLLMGGLSYIVFTDWPDQDIMQSTYILPNQTATNYLVLTQLPAIDYASSQATLLKHQTADTAVKKNVTYVQNTGQTRLRERLIKSYDRSKNSTHPFNKKIEPKKKIR